jgi:hypothetical protein
MHATVCDYIADVVQNAVEAGATRIDLEIGTGPDRVMVQVSDNGKGMDEERLRQARDPFFSEAGKHDQRRVGLGLPLLCQAVEALDGAIDLQSAPGRGTTVAFRFDAHHVDAPPTGDLPGTLCCLLALPGEHDLAVRRHTPAGGYTVERGELLAALGDLDEALNLALARQYLTALEREVTEAAGTGGTRSAPPACKERT